MTRTRKVTLSMREFSHLVSESLDIANAITPSFVDNTAVVSESHHKSHTRLSSFQRIFSRPTPTPGQREDSPDDSPEDPSEAPRKMIGWPFSRSPRKNRPTNDEDHPTVDEREGISRVYSVPSLATSTSSLGSVVPAHERLFQVASRDSDEPGHDSISSSPITIAPPLARELSNATGFEAPLTPLDAIFRHGTAPSVRASSTIERGSASFDDDPTPRASTFGSRATLPAAGQDALKRRPYGLSLVVPLRDPDMLALRPAIGVAPHAPSETGSLCSTSPPTSPVAPVSSPTFPPMKPSESEHLAVPLGTTPSNVRISAQFPGIAAPSNLESVGLSPRPRKRATSRSQTPPPLPRPPPTGPLPAVPSSVVPPVPPLPPLLCKMSMHANPHTAVSSSPRSTMVGAPANPATALPPSPPGGLRLPSRLSWVNTVRAVLPSPPASPTKSLKSLTGKTSLPISPEMKRPIELKRPTSIGVIEAADNVQVRRTKSILLLGSRSKSNASLGPKRVQIRADTNVDATGPKPRRKSSAATFGHPVVSSSSDFALLTPMPSSELLVPRERRHSAPVLSSVEAKAPTDWTLSLPFCTDVPGQKILPSPSLTPQPESTESGEAMEVEGEDWTLCMPLKVRTPTVASAERHSCEGTIAETEETGETRPTVSTQLPTPSPSPTWPSPVSVARPLEEEVEEQEEASEPVPEERPVSPASLGPHAGGLDLAGGRGKRASGWHVYGWFDEVDLPDDDGPEPEPEHEADLVSPTTSAYSDSKLAKNHVTVFRRAQGHPSQDSTSTVSTSGATFYSARSSLMVS